MAIPVIPITFFFSFLALFLLQPLHFAFARIDLRTKISTNDRNASWLSSSGDFAFGFLPINNNYSTNLFFLAIWFNKIQDRTILWYADIQTPIPLGSTLWLTTMGLSLINPQGEAIYKVPSELDSTVSYAEMRDDGNFVLALSDSSYLWQSFNNPTDTLLPTQTLSLNSKLFSRLSPTNYTKGRFELYFDNGHLSLAQTGWLNRYTKYFDISNSSNDSASQLIFNSSVIGGQIAIGLGGSGLDVGRFYYRATLEYYGVFSLYSHPKESNEEDQVWSIKGYVPDNICTANASDMGSGSCGYNSYCIWDDNNKRPTCKCPEGYSWADPKDEFGGCKPDISLGCGSDDAESNENPQEVYEMKPLQDVNWPLGDYERLSDYTREECEQSCLNDCNCAVAISNAAKDCWKKRLPLSNGRIEAYQNLTTALLKIRKKPLGSIGKEDRLQLQHALLGSLIGSLVVNTLLVATVVSVILLKTKKVVVQVSSFVETTTMHSFTYEALMKATHGFSEEVGRGSFGIVYKGTLNSITNDTTVVAVKRLDRMAPEREKEFRNELSSIGRTCHRNLVRLIGFCDEGVHRLLVYEFMSNGTLADILFKQPKPTWNLRVNLALGIARGILYLHEECETPIIHCDIKPQNILIDDHFMPKVSDFGLAKLLYSNKSRTHTMIRGTRGYVAPEWFKNVPVTVKVDVYSYGVMLLEIICCKRSVALDLDEVEEEAILIDWVYDCYMERRIQILVENDEEAISDIERMKKWVMIALWCIQENPQIRPTMKTVMQMLEGLIEVSSPPFPALSFTSIV